MTRPPKEHGAPAVEREHQPPPRPGIPDPLRQAVDLDLFEGPLDLLLTLVLREEVDLLELPVAGLVEATLGERGETRWDPGTASELVVLLAALAELKARLMLGEPADEEPDADAIEARERLAARLIAYAPFARAAEWLAERGAQSSGPRYRAVDIAEPAQPPPERVDAVELQAAMETMLTFEQVSLAHLESRRSSLPQALQRLRDALGSEAEVSFERHVGKGGATEEAITLVAALELSRAGEVRLDQPRPLGDIAIKRRRG